jgi:hypothetical protein
MASVNRHEKPEVGVTEIRVHGVGGTAPEALLEQTGTRQVAGDDTAGFFRGAIPDPTRTVEAYSWGGLTAKSRSRAFWVLLLPFSLINLAGWMVEPRPLRGEESGEESAEGPTRVAVDRDFGTKVHETIVQLIAIATTAMYVMWTALISVNTIAFQCGAISECRESRWFVEFFDAGFFVDHPGRRVIVGLLPPLVLLAFFMYLGSTSRVRYDEFGKREGSEISADTVGKTRTAIGRVSFWYPGWWQKQTGRLHVAVILLIIGGLLGRAVGRFEETFGVEVANERLGAWIFRLSVVTAIAAIIALTAATGRSDPLLGHGVDWFKTVSSAILAVAVALFAVSLWLTARLEAADAALVPPGEPAIPITDFWGFGWSPVLLLVFAILLVGVFTAVQIVRWIQWHFIHFDQILVAAMLLMIVLWPWAVWVAVASAIIAVVADLLDRFRPGRRAAENGDGTKKVWRLAVFLAFMGATVVVRVVSEEWAPPFGVAWPRVTPMVFFTCGLAILCIIQATGHLNAAGTEPRRWRVQVAFLAVPAGFIAVGWWLTAILNREEWVYGTIGLAWCVAAVVWLAQFEHARWRWNGPGAVAMLGLAIIMGAFSGLMIWLVDLLDGDGTQFALAATAIYQWLTVMFAAMLGVLIAGQAGWYLFAWLGLGRPAGAERRRGEVLPVALRAIDVVLTVAVMVLLASMIALIIHLNDAYREDYLAWINDGPPEDWAGIVKVTAWIALGVVIGAVLAVRNGLRDRGFRTKIGILWDVVSFWPRSFHPFAPPPYTARAVPEIQSRLKEVADLNEPGTASEEIAPLTSAASAVILSGHSQGSVVSLAVIATLPPETRRYVWLFTHGSPLATLYRRFFPMYFPVELFTYCAQVDGRGRLEEGRWLNYWRRTDPIGGPCFAPGPGAPPLPPLVPPWSRAALDASRAEPGLLPDIQLDDPLADPPTPYSPSPSVRGHSGYMADPAMWRALDVLAGELMRIAQSSPDGVLGISADGSTQGESGDTPSPDHGPVD